MQENQINIIIGHLIKKAKSMLLADSQQNWQEYMQCYVALQRMLTANPSLNDNQIKALKSWHELVDRLIVKLGREQMEIIQELGNIQLTENYGKQKSKTTSSRWIA